MKIGINKVFWTVTDADTTRTNSQSTRFDTFEVAEREAAIRCNRGPGYAGTIILQSIALRLSDEPDPYEPFKKALAEGKVVQFLWHPETPQANWRDCGPSHKDIRWDGRSLEHIRIKPQPRHVPMEMKDFATVAIGSGGAIWFRIPRADGVPATAYLLQSINERNVGISAHGNGIDYRELKMKWEYSTNLTVSHIDHAAEIQKKRGTWEKEVNADTLASRMDRGGSYGEAGGAGSVGSGQSDCGDVEGTR